MASINEINRDKKQLKKALPDKHEAKKKQQSPPYTTNDYLLPYTHKYFMFYFNNVLLLSSRNIVKCFRSDPPLFSITGHFVPYPSTKANNSAQKK